MGRTALDVLGLIVFTCVFVIVVSAAWQVLQWVAANAWALAFRALNAFLTSMDVAARRIAQEAKAALLLMFRLSCWMVRMALTAVTQPLWSRVAPRLHAVRARVKRWTAGFDRASKRPRAAERAEPRLQQARSKPAHAPRMSHEEAFKLTLQTIEKAKQRR